jgi:hypothetical protein
MIHGHDTQRKPEGNEFEPMLGNGRTNKRTMKQQEERTTTIGVGKLKQANR